METIIIEVYCLVQRVHFICASGRLVNGVLVLSTPRSLMRSCKQIYCEFRFHFLSGFLPGTIGITVHTLSLGTGLLDTIMTEGTMKSDSNRRRRISDLDEFQVRSDCLVLPLMASASCSYICFIRPRTPYAILFVVRSIKVGI